MAIAMVAMLAFGGTYAYFTAQATKVESDPLTTGKILLKNSAVTFVDTTVVPKTELLANGTLGVDTTDTTVKTYVFVKSTVNITAGTATLTPTLNGKAVTEGGWTALTQDKDGQALTGVYYITVDNTSAGVKAFADSIVFEADANYVDGTSGTNTEVEGATITVTFESKAIQAFNGYGEDGAAVEFTPAEAYAEVQFKA